MSWSSFNCTNPDFSVRSIPDDVKFDVSKNSLINGSEVFRNMFSICDVSRTETTETNVLDLDEAAGILTVLLRLIHEPPEEYDPVDFVPLDKFETQIPVITPTAAIPLPLLPKLFQLADKYELSQPIVRTLQTHLVAHKSTSPLRVYGIATQLSLDTIAAEASYYLLLPPLRTYSLADIRSIPTAEAYHKLVLLHSYRISKLREIVLGEEIFPHGYGECPAHKLVIEHAWDERRKEVAIRIESGGHLSQAVL
ncbi:hypothetical protein BD410DRAFT_738597 [Rickenella mellea]|uniref:BTB domain-containing protein n=1 Tax=Rickenella mellea TaxID=50990 RepID=A0A4Y7QNI9_9AGAM|nr:hypothetical protein BD410DRAFT_738597 [Rickenella mellea]